MAVGRILLVVALRSTVPYSYTIAFFWCVCRDVHRSQMEATTSCEMYRVYSVSQSAITAYKVSHHTDAPFISSLSRPDALFSLSLWVFCRHLRQSNTQATSTVSQGTAADGCTRSTHSHLRIISSHHRINRRCGALSSISGPRFVRSHHLSSGVSHQAC